MQDVKGLRICINFLIYLYILTSTYFLHVTFREVVYDDEDNLLEEKVKDANEMKKEK
jgi:hypothetical protein